MNRTESLPEEVNQYKIEKETCEDEGKASDIVENHDTVFRTIVSECQSPDEGEHPGNESIRTVALLLNTDKHKWRSIIDSLLKDSLSLILKSALKFEVVIVRYCSKGVYAVMMFISKPGSR